MRKTWLLVLVLLIIPACANTKAPVVNLSSASDGVQVVHDGNSTFILFRR